MTSVRWQTVSQIFQVAVDLPPEERARYIREACAGDTKIESEVTRLLAADENVGSFLERPAISTLPRQTNLAQNFLLPVGSLVASRFQIVRFIGQGGMGQVYEALDLELKSRVALKAIQPEIAADPRMLARFRREVQLTRIITHPNVCRTFDIERHSIPTDGESGSACELTFLTMELLEGETLSAFLRRQGRLSTDETLPLVLQMIDALSAAHAVGVIHRDFKPSNVLLVPRSKSPGSGSAGSEASSSASSSCGLRVVVTDFGLARAGTVDSPASVSAGAESVVTSLTGDLALMGTLVYMAPEQFERGETSIASDIYSLGLVIFEMVTGQRPFADDISFAEAAKRLKQPAPSAKTLVPEVPSAWDAAISRCLALDPKDRFQTVRDVAETLANPASATTATRSTSSTTVSPTELFSSRHRKYVLTAAVVVMLVSLSAVVFRHYWMKANSSHLAPGSNVLVARIENVSGDPDLTSVAELLKDDLSQSSYMNLLEPSRVKEELHNMSKPKDTALEPGVAREVGWRAGVPLVIFGTVSRVAEDYKLDLKAEQIGSDPLRPKSSWSFSEAVANKKDFFDVVRHGGTWVRKLAGEMPRDIDNADRILEDVTTSNWEALQLYSEGQHLASVDDDHAFQFYKRAIEKDPEFAMAWMRLGDSLDTLGRSGEGFGYWKKALAISGERRLTPREELRIKGMYASDTGDLKAAIDYFSQYSLAYPNDYIGYFYRGVPLMLLGRTEEAIQILHEAEKRAPDSYYVADHLARYNLILGNYSEVARYTARVRQLGHPYWADEVDGLAAAASGDYERAQTLFSGLAQADEPYLRSLRPYLQACVLAAQGRNQEAISTLKAGADTDRDAGDLSSQATKLLGLSYLYFRGRDREKGRGNALDAVKAESGASRLADAGTLLARAGFITDAQRLLAQIDGDESMVDVRVAHNRLNGEILLAQKRCPQALTEFEKAKSEDQEPALLRDYWAHGLFVCGRQQEASDELHKLSSKPGQSWHQPEFYLPLENKKPVLVN